MVKMVEEDPFIPIAWQKDHKGMQGTEYFTNERISNYSEYLDGNEVVYQLEEEWLEAKNCAIEQAKNMNQLGLTKQLCNRLLEPFMWHTVLLTATEFENFFELRCPKYKLIGIGGEPVKSRKDWLEKMQFSSSLHPSQYPKTEEEWWLLSESGAEIHMQALAEAMWDAYNESTPKELESGEWHIPFGDKMQDRDIMQYIKGKFSSRTEVEEAVQKFKLKVSTARCARLSYMTFDGEIDYEKDLKLHDTLLESHHMSPFEHCARAMSGKEYCTFIKGKSNANWDTDLVTDNTYEISAQFDNSVLGWCRNLKGFIPYRAIIENSN